jgi:hypothetical protein
LERSFFTDTPLIHLIMSKENKPQRRGASPQPASEQPTAATPARDRRSAAAPKERAVYDALLLDNRNYLWIGVGIALIALGFLLMSGGGMDNPNDWDESKIYSFRRITLAPIVVLSGIGVVVYAIFSEGGKKDSEV